jgi:release factor glutamine methyltransferase
LESIQRSTEFLARKGVESPRLQVELALAHLLKIPRMRLYLDFERQLQPSEVEDLREMMRRRGQREPLQYVLGSMSFCGLELTVTPDVLIPRPETELLAEKGWEFLNASLARGASSQADRTPLALDVGTGSGCLAIALAFHCPQARVVAVDLSAAALELARQNAARHGTDTRIRFLHGNGFAALPEPMAFDLIVSNPPYIPSGEIAALQPEVRDYEPRQALDGGADGLDYYRRWSAEAAPFLRAGGRLMVELGAGQAERATEIFQAQKWIVERIEQDYNQHPRILVACPG